MKTKHAFKLAAALVVSLSSLLTFSAPLVHANALSCSWSGAVSNSFNTAGNWTNCGGVVPQTGDNLIFDNTSLSADAAPANDITGLSVGNITFSGTGTHVYTISGTQITTTGNITQTTTTASDKIITDIALGADLAVTNAGSLELTGSISGAHNLVKAGTGGLELSGNNVFTGIFNINAGDVYANAAGSLGASSNVVYVNDGSDVTIGSCSDATGFTVANNFSLAGASSSPSGSSPTAKLTFGAKCQGGGGYDESYGTVTPTNQQYTLSGNINLGADTTVETIAKTTTLTGALTGTHAFSVLPTYGGSLVLNGSTNTTSTPNGTLTAAPVTPTLSDSQPTHAVYIGNGASVTVDGARGDTTVDNGGTLFGSGTLGALFVNAGGTVAPGHSPGCLTTTGLTLNGTYQFQIGGTTACTGYDQIKVLTGGIVDVTGGTLDTELYQSYVPKVGESYTIIDNQSPATSTVTGTFTGLAEGATFVKNGVTYSITYKGGDGNDVVVTVTAVTAAAATPKTPDTGLAAITAHPIVSLLLTLTAGTTLLIVARRVKLARA